MSFPVSLLFSVFYSLSRMCKLSCILFNLICPAFKIFSLCLVSLSLSFSIPLSSSLLFTMSFPVSQFPSLSVVLCVCDCLLSKESNARGSRCFNLIHVYDFCPPVCSCISALRGANPSVLGGRSSALRNFSRSSVRSQNLPLTKTQNLPLVLSVSKLSRDRLFH